VCELAAAGGHLEVLQWARVRCSWDEGTCAFAALGGHLAVLQWAREGADPPCLWDWRTCAFAAGRGRAVQVNSNKIRVESAHGHSALINNVMSRFQRLL